MFGTQPTIIFSTGDDWFSWLVRTVTLSDVGHVSIGLGDHMLHARDCGVVVEPRSNWFLDRAQRHVAEFEIVPDVSRNILRCLSHVGEPYDKPGLLRVGLGIALRRSLSLLKPWPADPGSHTCAAFAMMIDPDGELIPEWRDIARRDAVPSDLYGAMGSSFRRIVQPIHQL
jgi:hypothetical protein